MALQGLHMCMLQTKADLLLPSFQNKSIISGVMLRQGAGAVVPWSTVINFPPSHMEYKPCDSSGPGIKSGTNHHFFMANLSVLDAVGRAL